MGSILSEPKTDKETSSCANESLKVGASCMQGWRLEMEDAHTHLLSLSDDEDASFFAVYDGHCGEKVSRYVSEKLPNKISNHSSYKKGFIVEAIKQSFLELDSDILVDDKMRNTFAGSTAVTVLLKDGKIYCANVGDSRAICSLAGEVQQLSFDHKPNHDREYARITAAGGSVQCNRVDGNLALSRAFGDFMYKQNKKLPAEKQIVTVDPDVIVKDLTPEHEFIVLACDGIWDVMSNEEVVDFIRTRISYSMEPEQICEELMTHCLAPDTRCDGNGCDNMTVVLVCFLQGGTYQDLADKCVVGSNQLSPMDQRLCCSDSSSSERDEVESPKNESRCDEATRTPPSKRKKN